MGMFPGTENYMLDQGRTVSCSRNQHIAGGKGGVLIYVRTTSITTSLEGAFAESNLPLAWMQLAGQTAVMSWNSLSTTDFQDGRTFNPKFRALLSLEPYVTMLVMGP